MGWLADLIAIAVLLIATLSVALGVPVIGEQLYWCILGCGYAAVAALAVCFYFDRRR